MIFKIRIVLMIQIQQLHCFIVAHMFGGFCGFCLNTLARNRQEPGVARKESVGEYLRNEPAERPLTALHASYRIAVMQETSVSF